MHSQMWLSGASKGKGVFGAEGSSKGGRADGCCAETSSADCYCLLCHCWNRVLGDTLLFSPVSFEFCYWVAVELIFLQSMKFTPGPVQYSSFLLLWHLLPSAPLTLLAPHLLDILA